MNENYIFYPNKDSPGGDLYWAGNKSLPELILLCEKDSQCLAFNTLGYMKHTIQDESKFINLNGSHGMYVHKKRFQERIKSQINKIINQHADITFVITTCKRLPLFIRTMNQFLLQCQDITIIKNWICIDDNSSEEDRKKMKDVFPFFQFINKPLEEKGHPESINIFLDKVQTKYALLFEDDWVCGQSFHLQPYIDLLESGKYNLDQIVLCQRYGEHPELPIILNNKSLFDYKYNHYHAVKPELNIKLDQTNGKWDEKRERNDKNGWWWPGISYNPSVWKMEKFKEVGSVRTDMAPELFEYQHSMDCYDKGLKVAFTNLEITHIGFYNSAYKKNGYPRYYEL